MNAILNDMSCYLYRLASLLPLSKYLIETGEKEPPYLHKMLLLSGRPKSFVRQKSYRSELQKLIITPPGENVSGYVEGWENGLVLSFSILRESSGGRHVPVCLEQPLEYDAVPGLLLMNIGLDIMEKLGGDARQRMKANILFQDLLLSLFEGCSGSNESVQERAITKSVEYMHRNYKLSVNRERLAEVAGMSVDYYSKIFKKQLGKTPVEFLTEIRLKHAKQALLSTKDSFRAIAQSVGYADEFYFSRKFRTATGLSPSQYVRRVKAADRIVPLQHHLTGHMLALGIEPYAALINGYYPVELKKTREIGTFRPDLDKLTAAEPDVILTCEVYDEETSVKARMFEHIAETVTIPFFDDWRTQLRKVAITTGREEAAEDWLMQYELKAQKMRADLASFTEGKSLLIVGVGNGSLCLFGHRNVGAVVYGDLGLQAPEDLGDIRLYREISYGEIYGYNTDILLFASFRNDGSPLTKMSIREMMQRIQEDPRWMEMRAVRSGRVYSLFEHQHLYTLYSAYSHNLLLDKLWELWRTDLSK
ncbi:helix-turn-helix domain-containing protein [Paenibacillus sp. BAC0078]